MTKSGSTQDVGSNFNALHSSSDSAAVTTGGHQERTSSIATRLVQTGRAQVRDPSGPMIRTVNPDISRASSIEFASTREMKEAGEGAASGAAWVSSYGTVGTSTTFHLRDAIEEIEGHGHDVRAALVPSGLAAITTAVLAFVRSGDHVLIPDSAYGPTRVFADTMLARMGVSSGYYDPTVGSEIVRHFTPSTRLVLLESPGSYTFEIQDVPAICAAARQRGITSILDNTYGSPGLCLPFDLGVDISVVALSKYWGGHSDVLMGAVVCRNEHWMPIWQAIRQLGLVVGADDASLVLRGLRTARLRMDACGQAGLEVARWIEQHELVKRVLHPALASHPQHELFIRDFHGCNGLFSFELVEHDMALAERICDACRLFNLAYSWGGYESLVTATDLRGLRTVRPWAGGPLLRLHCGLEEPGDLIADLEQAFGRAVTER